MPAFLPIVSKFDSKGIKTAEGSLKKFGKIAGGIAAAATAAVAGIATAGVREFVKFDEALNKSTAIMGDLSDALRNDMADAAREVAKSTRFSSEEAAESFFFLASAGLDAEQQIAALPQVAAFAQAGMFDMATATDLATDAQSALGLASDDASENLDNLTRVTDVFVKANTLANTSVEQLAAAFTTKAGTALNTVGKDVEEGAAALAVFADQGIKGEKAGTLLTNTIFGLTDVMKKAPAEAEALGLSIFDAEGNLKNFGDIAENLTDVLGDMTTEQKVATIDSLGLTKQAREGVFAFLDNADSIREYEGALRDAGGTTQEVADKQLATPAAQFDLLKSSVQDLLLEFKPLALFLGDLAEGFRPIVDSLGPKLRQFFDRISPSLEAAGESFKNLGQAFKDGEETIGGVFANIFDTIKNFFTGDGFSNALDKFMEFRQTFIFALIGIIPEIARGLAEAIPAIVRAIVKAIPAILEASIEIFRSLVEALTIVLPLVITALTEAIPTIIEAILFQLPLIIQGAIDLFNGLLSGLLEVLPILIEALVAAIPMILAALIDALPALIDGAFQLFMGIVEGVIDATPEIIDATIELIPAIIEALIEAGPQLADAGFELIKGIVKGIVDNGPRLLTSAIKGIGNNLTAGFKAIMQIRSPSRVFEGLGGEVVEGLKNGLDEGQRVLAASSLNMASTVRVSTEDGLGRGIAVPASTTSSSASQMPINITINAGMGANGQEIGKEIVNQIRRYERINGPAGFAR